MDNLITFPAENRKCVWWCSICWWSTTLLTFTLSCIPGIRFRRSMPTTCMFRSRKVRSSGSEIKRLSMYNSFPSNHDTDESLNLQWVQLCTSRDSHLHKILNNLRSRLNWTNPYFEPPFFAFLSQILFHWTATLERYIHTFHQSIVFLLVFWIHGKHYVIVRTGRIFQNRSSACFSSIFIQNAKIFLFPRSGRQTYYRQSTHISILLLGTSTFDF